MTAKFAMVITSHRVLGPVFQAVLVRQEAGQEFLTIAERLSSANLNRYATLLYPEQIRLVQVMEEYGDTQLLKVFTKKKIGIHAFLSQLEGEFLERQVRPYIERRLNRCIELLTGSDTLIFMKQQQHNFHPSDRVYLQEESANAVFHFIRNKEGLQYSVSIHCCGEHIQLTGRPGFVLVNDPCMLILGNRLFMIDDIDGKKLLPFFSHASIHIRKETEKKFLESFARKIIQKYQVHVEGFRIVDRQVQPEPVLSLEHDLQGRPVFILRFRYDEKHLYEANLRSELRVSLKEHGDEIDFIRQNRDPSCENGTISALLEIGLANTRSSAFIPLDLAQDDRAFSAYDLVNWLNANSDALAALGISIDQKHARTNYYLQRSDLQIRVSEGVNDWFDVQAFVCLEGFEIPFVRFRDHLLTGNREYELPDGKILVLPETWFARFKNLFTFAREDKENLIIEKQHFSLLESSLRDTDVKFSDKMRMLVDAGGYKDEILPGGIAANLRDYQKEGYSWLWGLNRFRFGGCLADDMGLGKTLQTLTLLMRALGEEKLKEREKDPSGPGRQLTIFDTAPGGAGATAHSGYGSPQSMNARFRPSLVVVPSTLVHNWINEIRKFAPSISTGYYGGQHRTHFSACYATFDLIITTYGYVRNDIEVLKNLEFLYLILDESQVIKNPRSKTYQAVTSLHALHRLVLTGTPIENSLTDLWAQMNFLNPGLLGSFSFFRNEFAIPIEKNRNVQQTRMLKTLINPFVLRRTKSQVARELPELSEQQIYCDMTEAQSRFYETEKSRVRNLILDHISIKGMQQSAILILQSLTKLRQAANHPALVEAGYEDDSGKYHAVIDNILNLVAEKHKVLIFSSFVKHLDLYTRYCAENGIGYSCLTGDVPQQDREQIIREFQEGSDRFLFFISLRTGGIGLNLTAAEYVFILDPWWNPAAEDQAVSRAHRMGQQNKVFVYRFISKDTIEEKIRALQEIKSELAGKFIDSNHPFNTSDKEEILQLFD